MPEFIRVRAKDTGIEQTIAKPSAVDPKVYEVLKQEDATDKNGRPLPPKVPSKSGQKAATEKES